MAFVWTNRNLNDAASALRKKVAERREAFWAASKSPPETKNDDVPVLTDAVSRKVLSVTEDVPFRGELSRALEELEREIECVDGKIANLMEIYAITPEKLSAGLDVLVSAKKEDFVRESSVPSLDSGHALEVGIDGFSVFRILKIVPTAIRGSMVDSASGKSFDYERSICQVLLQTAQGKKGKRELLITFPIVPGEHIVCHDPSTQQFLMKREVRWASVNRKTLKERFLSLFQ